MQLGSALGIGIMRPPSGVAVALASYDFTGGTLGGGSLTRASTGRYLSDSDVLTAAAIDTARYDYAAGGALRGLLIEPARTNIFIQSEDFSNGAWTKNNTTVSTNAAVAPDGTTTADRLVETTAAAAPHSTHQVFSAVNGTIYGASAFVKAGEITVYGLAVNQVGGGAPSYFNLSTGAVTPQASHTAGIEDWGGGWYRIWIVFTAVSTATASVRLHLCPSVGTYIYTGNTANGGFVWGGHNEVGASATSYVPTTTVAVARSADVLALTAPAGTAVARYTFDDLTTQDVATVAGAFNVPTNLNRSRLRRVDFF